jgi:membrane protease YdiL (CAAX protease family)
MPSSSADALTAPTAIAPAGWHADPYGRRRERWWDGSAWSAYVRDTEDVDWDDEPFAARAARSVEPTPSLPALPAAVIGFVVGVAACFLAPSLVAGEHPLLSQVVSSAGLWLGLLAACGIVSARHGTGSIVNDLGFRFRWIDVGIGLGASIAGRMATAAALAPLPVPSTRLRDLGTDYLPSGSPGLGTVVVVALIVCVGAPVVEELFFRGLLQPRLVERLGGVAGVATTSVLFGAAHLIGWAGAISLLQAWAIAAAGLILGYLRESTGRLGPSIMAHFFFNAQVVALVVLLS